MLLPVLQKVLLLSVTSVNAVDPDTKRTSSISKFTLINVAPVIFTKAYIERVVTVLGSVIDVTPEPEKR